MEVYIGTICAFAFNFTPYDWVPCDGTQYQVAQYQALAALIAGIYGSYNGSQFNVPDLRGRVALGMGILQSSNPKSFTIGGFGGTENFVPSQTTLPPHNHTVSIALACNDTADNSTTPVASYLSVSPGFGSGRGSKTYVSPPGNVQMANTLSVTLAPTGVPAPPAIDTRSPYVATTYYIATQGWFPVRS